MADETKARMTGPEHYRQAERLLLDPASSAQIDAAQVHATLALVAVTAELASHAAAPVGQVVYSGLGEPNVDGPWKALLNPTEATR